MSLTKPSGGEGVNAELIFSTCDTNVGSFGTQLPITMRPPGFVTRTIIGTDRFWVEADLRTLLPATGDARVAHERPADSSEAWRAAAF